jgi:hypothetical protein
VSNVIEKFVAPLRVSFVVPQGFDPVAFGVDMEEALDGFSDHQLTEAVRWIKHNRTHRTFPTIAECRQACERFSAAPSARRSSEFQSDEEKRSEAIRQRIRERDAILLCQASPLSHQANREGWLVTLLEFVEDRGTMPNEFEVRRLKAKSAAVDANLHREPRPQFYEVLCKLRAEMKDRAAKRLWGEPVVDVAKDRRRALADQFDEFKRRFG